jgi:hypothetical protein
MRETRVGEVVTLGRDPILLDSTGAPCLLYHEHKGRRETIVAEECPMSPWLFPGSKSLRGPIAAGSRKDSGGPEGPPESVVDATVVVRSCGSSAARSG